MECVFCKMNLKTNFFSFFNSNGYCHNCFSKFEFINQNITMDIDGKIININVLFKYNYYSKEYMYTLKEQANPNVTYLFTYFLNKYIRETYQKDITLLPLISSDKEFKRRGYYTNEALIENLNYKYILGPNKISNDKQGKLSLLERVNSIQIYEEIKVEYKDLLIIDDVIVSGATLRQVILSISNYKDLNINVLILFGGTNLKKDLTF